MKPLIDPVDPALLESELTERHFMRDTNKGNNRIYVFRAAECPQTMREVGRLRELSFRDAGGGTGEASDIDEADTAPDGYQQLIVWDPAAREIIGGYRFIVCRSEHPPHLSTEHYFRFSDRFREEYLPHTVELGRSFIQPAYQGSRANPKGLFALDNVWNGLGTIMVDNPDMKYMFGKVTMYGDYDREARDLLIYFLRKYFADTEALVEPIHPVQLDIDEKRMAAVFTGRNYDEDYKILGKEIRRLNQSIPPLINSYMNLSQTMRVFG
ncbi:MAG: GNAT family N-acetyltransferase, partial [Rikenellaceae bacterium]|nr:GNAT family N-acetyltransferase [Rikenellaceae bacterium]